MQNLVESTSHLWYYMWMTLFEYYLMFAKYSSIT